MITQSDNNQTMTNDEPCFKKCAGNSECILFLLSFVGGVATMWILDFSLNKN